MQRASIFAALVLAFFASAARANATDRWATWDASRTTTINGTPVLTVEKKPFFVYGAAFFYERIPRAQWRGDLEAYKRLGINTIDLYVIWNWHEPQEGTIDFDGSTNPRRDLDGLLAIIHSLGFKVILRPGPIIRNEWRNAGYPDYLLRLPEYDMPLHDVLEGRYPATATYQNAHADAAADQWLHNPTHLREAAAWLRTALLEVEPWSHDVIAVALDDDQGAYLDNDTWPAPHWHAYMDWLKAVVQRTVGPNVPLFINTFQMKVTASAPVWAWGNWYQSDAYRIGDHDLAQLAFSAGLLQTQGHVPLMASEFQAGWLQGADEISPRAAAPENTTLALHEMLQMGMHGIVNFPVQDTIDPAGYEAPWSNWIYSWDAAYATAQCGAAPCEGTRFAPTAEFGQLVTRLGPYLATLQPQFDVSIAWLASAYDPAQATNDRIAQLASDIIALQERCRALALTCRIVDLRFNSLTDLAAGNILVVPRPAHPIAFVPQVDAILVQLRAHHVRIVASIDDAVRAGARSSTGGIGDASLLLAPDRRSGILDIMNRETVSKSTNATFVTVGAQRIAIASQRIDPGHAQVIFIHDHLVEPIVNEAGAGTALPGGPQIDLGPHAVLTEFPEFAHPRPGQSLAYAADVFSDGEGAFVLDNGLVRAIVLPSAGARAVVFSRDDSLMSNAFTSIGALRDDVETPPSPSPRDYIAPYTHPLPAGTFNRAYACTVIQTGARAAIRCTYDAPDLSVQPVHFEKTFALEPGASSLSIDLLSSADARSISAVDPSLAIAYPTDAATRHDDETRTGYRLVTLHYPADKTERIVFTLKGATPGGTNRR